MNYIPDDNAIEHFVFVSGGNDSVALLKWIELDGKLDNIAVVYNNTGWSHPDWKERISLIRGLCECNGWHFYETESVGLEQLCLDRKMIPRFGAQFCTEQLKIAPSLALMDRLDPDKEACVMTGVRREESSRRANFPEWTENSKGHGGRLLWCPLVRHTEEERDHLIWLAGFEVLPHRSRECYPCIYANKSEVAALDEDRIDRIRIIEDNIGASFFNPKHKLGAKNIDEAIAWSKRNNRKKAHVQQECDSGYCGG